MEVHHHTNTPRKKWTHYFWEFLMLFLAVFCGFLAENQREHYVEGKREKRFMQMMLEDLQRDSAELARIERVKNRIEKRIDNYLKLIYLENPSDSDMVQLYQDASGCINTLRTDLQDRTSTQLKSAGNLRLVRDKAITDSLASYWYMSDIFQNTNQPNYDEMRKLAKDMIYTLFNFSDIDTILSRGRKKPQLVNHDFGLRVKLGNYLRNMRSQLVSTDMYTLNWTHTNLKRAADNLIQLIKREYDLD